MTDRYAVIGNPVAHSKSPRIHELFARETGQDMCYEAILAPLDAFELTVREFVAAGGRGLNVTVPFKEQAFRFATRRTARADAAGAVNTLMFDGVDILGDNTDGAGLVRDLKTNLGVVLAGRRVLLLGAGGAARGCVLPLLQESPAQLVIANRTADKARQLAATFSAMPFSLSLSKASPEGGSTGSPRTVAGYGLDELGGRAFDLVINATSTGLSDATLPLPPGIFVPGCFAYEMLYGKDTSFMSQARNAGARVADGLGMLVEQAAESFALWRGVRPDTAAVLAQLRGE